MSFAFHYNAASPLFHRPWDSARAGVAVLAGHARSMGRAQACVRRTHASTRALPAQGIMRAPVVGLAQRARIAWRALAPVLKAAVPTPAAWQPGRLRIAFQHHRTIDTAEALAAGACAIVLTDATPCTLAHAVARASQRRCRSMQWRHTEHDHDYQFRWAASGSATRAGSMRHLCEVAV